MYAVPFFNAVIFPDESIVAILELLVDHVGEIPEDTVALTLATAPFFRLSSVGLNVITGF